MSKRQRAILEKPSRPSATDTSRFDWLTPVSDDAPCGLDLEYDHDFVMLFANATSRPDVQYGAFVGSPEPLNWNELERNCRRLMLRTKDIRVAVLYARCRTRLGGPSGLAEGTGVIAAWLQAFPDSVHPQAGMDDDRGAALEMRMNALQALADPDGLLADVREIVLMKSTATRLQMRDVERAFAHPRSPDALAPDSVTQQLRDLRTQQPEMMSAFDETISNLAVIDMWGTTHLDTCLPDLSPLTRLLQLLNVAGTHVAASANAAPVLVDDLDSLNADGVQPGGEPASIPPDHKLGPDANAPTAARTEPVQMNRQAALTLISTARQWFETNEPSSPIPVLLKRAELLAGKRYVEIVNAIPVELLAQWDRTDRLE
ncbi:type VI secretion system protein TssA [Burkholderia sp. Nafp2/4-1b]|uniref:type VI secretion system protein TssA n=1 Tax=Burkholderia sp. Nafp2/4-1b TaxID=2116686 RepID=UPI000EF87764|nr:type VI secretion system ImpA family N-terminal domain-containing protein [Burkholderia sp. Nafp2/4-1b]RKT99196.1 type VI secretion system protein TssA [Burkholderia sp. Nafp2/4-1b]